MDAGCSSEAGGKGAYLAEMTKAGFPVPDGFVVLTSAYEKFIKDSDLQKNISEVLKSIDPQNTEDLENASQEISKLIITADLDTSVQDEIKKCFKKLDSGFVAVRSSATFEDGVEAAWAGQLDTYLNVSAEDLIISIKKCWASLFSPRALFYRSKQDVAVDSPLAVVVQSMLDSEASGVAFSIDPVTQNVEKIVIEAGYGLGELIVSGEITPDKYMLQKNPLEILEKKISNQEIGLFRSKTGQNQHVKINRPNTQKISDQEIVKLAKLIKKVESNYKFPCDIEWAKSKDKFYLLQCRPVTALNKSISEDQLDSMFLEQTNQESIMRFEGDFMPFQLMIDWWNYYDIQKNWSGIYPVLFFFTPQRTTAYISQDKYRGIAIETLSDFLSGKQLLSTYQKGYEKFANKISKSYEVYFSAKPPTQTEEELFKSYKDIHAEFQELVAWTLFYEQLDEKAVADVLKNYDIDLGLVWEAVKLPVFVSFDTRKKQLILDALDRKISPNYLRFAFTEYTFFADEKFVKDELNNASSAKLSDEIKRAQSLTEKAKEKLTELLIGSDQQTKDIVNILQWVLFCRDERKDILNQAELLLFTIAEELFNKWKVDKKHIKYAGISEVLKGREYIKSIEDDLAKRSKGFSVLYQKDRSAVIGYKNLKQQISELDQIILSQLKTTDDKKISGETGNRGVVEGKVRIVRKRSEFSLFQPGEILVTGMTRPEFVPLMEKASGIITDEGGITSHAAIVSRELDKPCLIGTKVATQVLNSGDTVMLDATRGFFQKEK